MCACVYPRLLIYPSPVCFPFGNNEYLLIRIFFLKKYNSNLPNRRRIYGLRQCKEPRVVAVGMDISRCSNSVAGNLYLCLCSFLYWLHSKADALFAVET